MKEAHLTYIFTTQGIAMLGEAPGMAQSADGFPVPMPGLRRGVLYEGCWTIEDTFVRANQRLHWLETCQGVTEPRQAELDACRAGAAAAEQRMKDWLRSAAELDRILADLDAGRVPAPAGDCIEPPQVARYADLIVDTAQRMFSGVRWPDDVEDGWQRQVDDLRSYAQSAHECAATAALTVESLDLAASSQASVQEMEAEALWPPPAMHSILHDGRQVLDWPECVTIGGEPVERRIIWNN